MPSSCAACQSVGDLSGDVDARRGSRAAFPRDDRRQRFAVDVLHHEVDDLVRLTVVEHRGDVRMEDSRSIRRLTREAGRTTR